MSTRYTAPRAIFRLIEVLLWFGVALAAVMAFVFLSGGLWLLFALQLYAALSCLLAIAIIHVGRAVFDISDAMVGEPSVGTNDRQRDGRFASFRYRREGKLSARIKLEPVDTPDTPRPDPPLRR